MMPLPIPQPRRKKDVDEHLNNPKKPYKQNGKGMIMRCNQCCGVRHDVRICLKKGKSKEQVTCTWFIINCYVLINHYLF